MSWARGRSGYFRHCLLLPLTLPGHPITPWVCTQELVLTGRRERGTVEEACQLPPVPSSADMIEAFRRALKEFTVISPESLLFDFFLLISDSLKAIYLRAYQGPSFLDAFEDRQKDTGGGKGCREEGALLGLIYFFFRPQFCAGDENPH